METIKKFAKWFSRQRLSGRIFIIVLGLLLVIGVCNVVFTTFTSSAEQSPSITAKSNGADNVIINSWTSTPTALAISVGSPTPTNLAMSTDSPSPMQTPLPTGLPTLSLSFETPTTVVLPTISRATAGVLVLITAVNKELEFVDIQNAGGAAANLRGWVLVSETGNQRCPLRGILQSKEILRIWAGKGQIGISCEFHNLIWLDEESDPAVLYNAKGEEVSRFP